MYEQYLGWSSGAILLNKVKYAQQSHAGDIVNSAPDA